MLTLPLSNERRELAARYWPAARSVAVRRFAASGGRRPLDDLVGAAVDGLTQAAASYDGERARFWTFARRRVDGAVRDELRRHPVFYNVASASHGAWRTAAVPLSDDGEHGMDGDVAVPLYAPDDVATPGCVYAEAERRLRLDDADPSVRALLRLVCVDGLSLAEAAARLGVPASTAYRRLEGFRRTLRRTESEAA